MPTKEHAATYAAILHYLKAIEATGTDEAAAVNRKMCEMPVDYFGRAGKIRANGRVEYEPSLYEVKAPAGSRYPWDYFQEVRRIPIDVAYRAAESTGCSDAVIVSGIPDRESNCRSCSEASPST